MKDEESNIIWENYMQEANPAFTRKQEAFERYSIEDLASMIVNLKDQMDPEDEYNVKRFLAMTISDLGGALNGD